MIKKLGLSVITGLAMMTSVASANTGGTFVYSSDNPRGGGIVNKMDFFEVSYTEVGGRDLMSLEYSFKPEVARIPNGFWLVVSDGPNPKGHLNEYAILYGDLNAGRVTAHVYSGQNNANSYQVPNSFIESFTNAIQIDAGSKTVSLSLDVTNINAFVPNNSLGNDWDGFAFDDNIGVWFHPADFTNVRYGNNGAIEAGHLRNRGWYDFANRPTTHEVSEPASLALLGLGLVGVAGLRRRAIAAA